MSYETLSLTRDGAIAEIRLQAGAADDRRFRAELDRAAGEIDDDASLRAVVLSVAGARAAGEATPPDRVRPVGETGDSGEVAGGLPFHCLELMRQPVIACTMGSISGEAFELILACDIRVASDDSVFLLRAVADGRVPSGGATQRLPRIIGRARAAEMLLLGEAMDAPAAVACGLVNALTPPAAVGERALALARTIAARGPIAIAYAKEAILRGLDMPLDQALRYETDLTVILQTTADRAEGVRAFLEKRPPEFEGR